MNDLFNHENIDLALLKKKAYNLRWAEQTEGVIPLTAADPDFPVAKEIRKSIIDYTNEGYFSYGPPEGLPELREALQVFFQTKRNISTKQDRVFVTNSAASGLSLVMKALLEDKGGEVIIFDPVDFLFPTSVESAGGIVKRIGMTANGWNLDDLEKNVSKNTKALMLCNPHNPVGKVWSLEELKTIVKFCEKYGLKIVSDEIWSDISYVNFTSIAAVNQYALENTYTIFGFSKSYGLAGFRIGCIVSPDEQSHHRIVDISQANSTIYGVVTLSQVAARSAIENAQGWLSSFKVHLKNQRDYLFEALNEVGYLHLDKVPEGTYVMFPKIVETHLSSEEVVHTIFKQTKLAVVAGGEKYFGPGSEGYLRVCYATSNQILKEAVDRLTSVVL